MSKYIDYKVTSWERVILDDEENLDLVIKQIKMGESPGSIVTATDPYYQSLDETIEEMSLKDNDGQPTIEIYHDTKLIWNNTMYPS